MRWASSFGRISSHTARSPSECESPEFAQSLRSNIAVPPDSEWGGIAFIVSSTLGRVSGPVENTETCQAAEASASEKSVPDALGSISLQPSELRRADQL